MCAFLTHVSVMIIAFKMREYLDIFQGAQNVWQLLKSDAALKSDSQELIHFQAGAMQKSLHLNFADQRFSL